MLLLLLRRQKVLLLCKGVLESVLILLSTLVGGLLAV